MTIKRIITALENGTLRTDDERAILADVIALFCPVSTTTMEKFQAGWNFDRPFDEFVLAQDKEILTCLKLELTEFGQAIRERYGMPLLNEEQTVV